MAYSRDLIERVVFELEGLSIGSIEPAKKYFGACHHIALVAGSGNIKDFSLLINLYGDFVDEWPLYSGDYHYPIPGESGDHGASFCFSEADNLWIGQYGENRRDFCKFVAEKLREIHLTDQVTGDKS